MQGRAHNRLEEIKATGRRASQAMPARKRFQSSESFSTTEPKGIPRERVSPPLAFTATTVDLPVRLEFYIQTCTYVDCVDLDLLD